jgi:hypothetical protein
MYITTTVISRNMIEGKLKKIIIGANVIVVELKTKTTKKGFHLREDTFSWVESGRIWRKENKENSCAISGSLEFRSVVHRSIVEHQNRSTLRKRSHLRNLHENAKGKDCRGRERLARGPYHGIFYKVGHGVAIQSASNLRLLSNDAILTHGHWPKETTSRHLSLSLSLPLSLSLSLSLSLLSLLSLLSFSRCPSLYYDRSTRTHLLKRYGCLGRERLRSTERGHLEERGHDDGCDHADQNSIHP